MDDPVDDHYDAHHKSESQKSLLLVNKTEGARSEHQDAADNSQCSHISIYRSLPDIIKLSAKETFLFFFTDVDFFDELEQKEYSCQKRKQFSQILIDIHRRYSSVSFLFCLPGKSPAILNI